MSLNSNECLWVAERLMSRARDKSKQIRQASHKELHPQLLRQLTDDMLECQRLAQKLQEEAIHE